MTLHKNQAFPQPDDNAKIWRYMPFAHFKQTVQSGTLRFGNAFVYDSDEGMLTEKERVIRRAVQIERQLMLYGKTDKPSKALEESDDVKKETFIICWTEGEREVQRMWEDKTGDLSRDVAIQSSFWRLRQILDQTKGYGFWTVKVKYIDHERDLAVLPNLMLYYARKNKKKTYENEVRALTNFFGLTKHEGHGYQTGLQIPADLGFLVESVVLSPYAPSLLQEVRDLLNLKGMHKPVRSSIYS